MSSKESPSGIYLLPNLLTTASLFAAFYSIVASLKGHYETAVIAIFIGLLADGLDGRIARLTNTQTDFGREYDSLADMVTSGVAPALLLYSWCLKSLGKFGWLVAFIYTASVALRLARFNTQAGTVDKNYFQGLSCTASTAFISSYVWLCHDYIGKSMFMALITAALAIIASVLMVSNIRYHSFKGIDFRGKIPFLYVLFIVILFVAIALNPSVMLFIAFSIYLLSGPLQTIISLSKVRKTRNSK